MSCPNSDFNTEYFGVSTSEKTTRQKKSQFAPVMFCPFQFLLWNRRVENLPRIICGNTSALPGPMRSLRLVSNKIKTAQHLLGTTCPSPMNIRVVFSDENNENFHWNKSLLNYQIWLCFTKWISSRNHFAKMKDHKRF